ncbi:MULTISPECIES: hypothetical protein [unclassified Spiroplasma]|uniref:hypothetical protein n=1 Tax=unclassified Spiroplasma TaxID=2637901 RepID=UPI0030D62EF5
MPIQNNNSKYFKEFITGTIISSTGILLTSLSLSTILFFMIIQEMEKSREVPKKVGRLITR